jgi:hypothetical protein
MRPPVTLGYAMNDADRRRVPDKLKALLTRNENVWVDRLPATHKLDKERNVCRVYLTQCDKSRISDIRDALEQVGIKRSWCLNVRNVEYFNPKGTFAWELLVNEAQEAATKDALKRARMTLVSFEPVLEEAPYAPAAPEDMIDVAQHWLEGIKAELRSASNKKAAHYMHAWTKMVAGDAPELEGALYDSFQEVNSELTNALARIDASRPGNDRSRSPPGDRHNNGHQGDEQHGLVSHVDRTAPVQRRDQSQGLLNQNTRGRPATVHPRQNNQPDRGRPQGQQVTGAHHQAEHRNEERQPAQGTRPMNHGNNNGQGAHPCTLPSRTATGLDEIVPPTQSNEATLLAQLQRDRIARQHHERNEQNGHSPSPARRLTYTRRPLTTNPDQAPQSFMDMGHPLTTNTDEAPLTLNQLRQGLLISQQQPHATHTVSDSHRSPPLAEFGDVTEAQHAEATRTVADGAPTQVLNTHTEEVENETDDMVQINAGRNDTETAAGTVPSDQS